MTSPDTWNIGRELADSWRRECAELAACDVLPVDFRNREVILGITETRHADWTPDYWNLVTATSPCLAERLYWFQHIDGRYPSSRTWPVATGMLLSSGMAAFAAQAANVEWLTGPLAGKHVVEIGGGYGGLAAIVAGLLDPASYVICDLPEAAALQRSFISSLGIDKVECNPSVLGEVDVVISCCALSELTPCGRDEYARDVLSRSKSGVVWWNSIGPVDGWLTDANDIADWWRAALPMHEVRQGTAIADHDFGLSKWAQYIWAWGLQPERSAI